MGKILHDASTNREKQCVISSPNFNLFSATPEYTWVMVNSGGKNLAMNKLIKKQQKT